MTVKLVASPGTIQLGGVICKPDGTIKSQIDLTSRVPDILRRRFSMFSRFLPCDLQHTTFARDTMCDVLVDLFDVGSLNGRPRILIFTDGFLDLLATVDIGNSEPAFGPSVSGVSPGLNLPWSDVSASDDGLAADFSMIDRDEEVILTGNVAISGEEMSFPSIEISVNDHVKILTCSYTVAP